VRLASNTLVPFQSEHDNRFDLHRDSVGGNAVVGDERWTGSFGVNVDLVARSHCSVAIIATQDILVMLSVHVLQLEACLLKTICALEQDIMEKFEFFPIKCRTERARQIYHKREAEAATRQAIQEGKKPLKSKVGINFALLIACW
jgi:hypothetical protein